MGRIQLFFCYCSMFILAWLVFAISPVSAQNSKDTGFSLEVSPSPLVTTLKPGENKVLELKIRNTNTITEQLKLELKSFVVDSRDGAVSLTDSPPTDIKDWVKFAQPNFEIKPGEWTTNRIQINTPETAGFTYYFAIFISRQNPKPGPDAKASIEGSIAVFTLLNIDRPGAINKLEIVDLTTKKRVYEYLPATLTMKIKNSGNTLVRPGGNVYVQRSSISNNPAAVLAVNPQGSYLLPGVTREFSVQWDDGFPRYISKQEAANTKRGQHLDWNWGKSQIRIGRYVAQVTVVYNDGKRDIPTQAEISFWVIPWKIILGLLLGAGVLIVGLVVIIKYALRLSSRKKRLR